MPMYLCVDAYFFYFIEFYYCLIEYRITIAQFTNWSVLAWYFYGVIVARHIFKITVFKKKKLKLFFKTLQKSFTLPTKNTSTYASQRWYSLICFYCNRTIQSHEHITGSFYEYLFKKLTVDWNKPILMSKMSPQLLFEIMNIICMS